MIDKEQQYTREELRDLYPKVLSVLADPNDGK